MTSASGGRLLGGTARGLARLEDAALTARVEQLPVVERQVVDRVLDRPGVSSVCEEHRAGLESRAPQHARRRVCHGAWQRLQRRRGRLAKRCFDQEDHEVLLRHGQRLSVQGPSG